MKLKIFKIINRIKYYGIEFYNSDFFYRLGYRYRFNPRRYKGTFLANLVDLPEADSYGAVPERIFVCWTGRNPMSPTRDLCLQKMREVSGVEVVLITPDNLKEWVRPEHPLHPAYDYLSLVHKSDYLRAYLMHYYGGAYSDVKAPLFSWVDTFRDFNSSLDKWVVSYPELSHYGVARLTGTLGRDLKLNYRLLIGCGAVMARSGTPLTQHWLDSVEKVLDSNFSALKLNPGGHRNEVPDYPLGWTSICGDIYHPLQLKYHQKIVQDIRMILDFRNYR